MRHLIGALSAGCLTATLLTSCAVAPVAAPLTREVVFTVDPAATSPQRRVTATIESRLALVFDAASVRQEGGNTTFDLVASNRGSAIRDLTLRLGGQRSLVSPGNPLALGALGAGSEVRRTVSFANADGGAFSVTVSLWALLEPSGSVSTAAR